jgi:Kef-type K+ transport system membrane component KefB
MDTTLIIGIILFSALIASELARAIGLPRVTGYILAGILLNPHLLPIIPPDFTEHTDFITNLALSFITFSVGGSLLFRHLKRLGRTIVWTAVGEAETAMLAVTGGLLAGVWLLNLPPQLLPLALLLGPLASPTDPSATLAVAHEYRARGDVTTTVMGVAALDDVLAILNFSLAVGLASLFCAPSDASATARLGSSVIMILIGLGVGAAGGLIFNALTRLLKRETEGALIVLVFAALTLAFGMARWCGGDELLATLGMGVLVANFNPRRAMIFKMLERYSEELIFALFFTISGMLLDLRALKDSLALIVAFVLLRAFGKWLGSRAGATLARAPFKVRRYVFWGLLPQGGIVVGLALLLRTDPAFDAVSDLLISVVLGATVLHELIGPLIAKRALQSAGEIPGPKPATKSPS